MKYYIHTFGCQSNKADSERIAGDYEARGFTEADSWKDATEIVINTCSVRQTAEDRARGILVNIANHFFTNKLPKPKIIITGCITHHATSQLFKMFPMVDEVLPMSEVGFNNPSVRKNQHHAWIPISSGCNSFCTYCIVPYSRGREQSRPMTEIIKEVENLAEAGYNEITLLGMNVNSYGLERVGIGLRKMLLNIDKPLSAADIPTNHSQYQMPEGTPPFVTLLRQISAIAGIEKIHFLTSNPWDFHDELIDEIAANPKIDRYIHLPIQSGSNRILRLMNRGYTVEDYVRLVEKIRTKIPNVTLGTDIIVGFPGETETDFADTVALAKKINWKIAFVARYSPRPGTAAYKLYPDDVPPAIKKSRWEILDQILNKDTMNERPKVMS